MKKSITGALLSGLVFPGFGQIVLGKKGLGVGLIIGSNIGLAGILISILKRIPLILEQLQPELEQGILSFEKMLELSIRYSSLGSGSMLEKVSMVILAGCWLFAVGHAWQLGSQQDKKTSSDT